MKAKQILYVALGCVSLGLGCLGVVLPILPTVPFLLLTAFFFAGSSPRLHSWFLGTRLYRRHLESYVARRGMTLKTKAILMGNVTALLALSFFLMARVPAGRIALAVVWVCHLLYFTLRVKTIALEEAPAAAQTELPPEQPGITLPQTQEPLPASVLPQGEES